jgi:hypothetical protein
MLIIMELLMNKTFFAAATFLIAALCTPFAA